MDMCIELSKQFAMAYETVTLGHFQFELWLNGCSLMVQKSHADLTK